VIGNDSKAHFECVLREAEARRDDLHRQIVELQRQHRQMETTISGILSIAPAGIATTPDPHPQNIGSKFRPTPFPDSQKYAVLSTRWAILLALSETSLPMSIPDLAEHLKAGGVRTEAANFNNNVSAVLSRMKSDRGEVDVTDGKWLITDIGRSAITYIKAQKLRRRQDSAKAEKPDAATSGQR
jgi:hypothetical protein